MTYSFPGKLVFLDVCNSMEVGDAATFTDTPTGSALAGVTLHCVGDSGGRNSLQFTPDLPGQYLLLRADGGSCPLVRVAQPLHFTLDDGAGNTARLTVFMFAGRVIGERWPAITNPATSIASSASQNPTVTGLVSALVGMTGISAITAGLSRIIAAWKSACTAPPPGVGIEDETVVGLVAAGWTAS
jgi:hypothetical protein